MTNDILTSSLKKMLSHCQELHRLLVEDQHYFINKDMDGLEQSNKRKTDLLEDLAQLTNHVNELNTKHSATPSLNVIDDESNEIKNLRSELENEMVKCYEHLAVNNKIVITNIQRIKEFWNKLTSLSTEAAFVYDQKANTHSK
jgi:hypothetical protein